MLKQAQRGQTLELYMDTFTLSRIQLMGGLGLLIRRIYGQIWRQSPTVYEVCRLVSREGGYLPRFDETASCTEFYPATRNKTCTHLDEG